MTKPPKPVKIKVKYKGSTEEEFFETTSHGRPSSILRRLIKKTQKLEREISNITFQAQFYKKLDREQGVRFPFRFLANDSALGCLSFDGKTYSFNVARTNTKKVGSLR